ncbi:MAG: nucleoside hydrolase [Chloroflexota bacterium]
MPDRIIIDTDPGVDDALAILMALGAPELEVEALTTVFGNVDVARTTRNALVILEAARRAGIPVFAGASSPIARSADRYAGHVHGESGLGDASFPDPAQTPEGIPAAEFLARRLSEPGAPETLVTLGPLTNLAAALQLNPSIASKVQRVVCMGGAVWVPGNASVVAESNVLKDPEAAEMVFASGIPVVLVPLDITMRTLLLRSRLDDAVARAGKLGDFVRAITPQYFDWYLRRYGLEGFALHDPCTIAYLVNPTLFQTQSMAMAVETGGQYCTGRLVPDPMGRLGRAASIQVCLNVDVDGLVECVLENLAHAGR